MICSVFFLHKGKPDSPRISEVYCEVTSARVQWLSSFNGGDNQQFTVFAYIGEEIASRSELVDDVGENTMHRTSIQFLRPSTMYFFYVFAKNQHGNSSSEFMSCKTLSEGIFFCIIDIWYLNTSLTFSAVLMYICLLL